MDPLYPTPQRVLSWKVIQLKQVLGCNFKTTGSTSEDSGLSTMYITEDLDKNASFPPLDQVTLVTQLLSSVAKSIISSPGLKV
jgi:hypothetical protein